jgi:hypothetical protein
MIERIITILASLEQGIKAIDRLAFALEQQNEIALQAIASSQQRLTGAVVAEQIEAMAAVATEVAAAEPVEEKPAPAPKPGKTRPTKAEMVARREAAKETVLLAGLRLDEVEAELKTLWGGWSSAQCEQAELMAAQAAEQAEAEEAQPEPVEEDLEEPTLTEDPAEDGVPDAGTVRAAVIAYSGVHGKPAARDLIQSIGKAEKLTEVAPENLAALYRAVTQAAA